MKLEPLGHRVLIDPEFESAEVAEGALKGFKLDVTESWEREKYKTQIGVIVAIGATAWKDFHCDPWANVGDKVYYSKYAHKSVFDGDKEYFIVNDEDIQCRVTETLPDFIGE